MQRREVRRRAGWKKRWRQKRRQLRRWVVIAAKAYAASRDQAILQGRTEQLAGGLAILGAVAVAGPVLSALSETFFKSGAEGVVDFAHAGGFAYAGAAATFVPGYLYFKATFSDIPDAWNQYYISVGNCAAPVSDMQ